MQGRNMAASGPSNNDYFYPGSIVKCITCYDDEFQGEVIVFDHDTKTLVLKQVSSSGKPDLNDVVILNVDFFKCVEVLKESETALPALTPLSSSKLLERYKDEIALKMTLAKARSCGVSNDGIQLFKFLRKAMPVQTVKWATQDISVMDEVLVKPPYLLDNCTAIEPLESTNQCLNHVKKIVERFHKEERLKSQPPGST